ncbi:MAG TPA: VWA domain-containing protein, partial [Thermoanaerobaculia bacterium]|nr:VWA domain-containing protein [Thermoanaerobaculia bacterium]
VSGLTKDDFQLFVNGQPQTIDSFDVVVDDGSAPAANAPVDLHRRRLFVLLFDTLNSSTIYIYRAKESALRFVDEAGPGDTFAVAVVKRDGIRFAVPFTNDRAAVRRAIVTLNVSMAGDAFNLAMLRSERMTWQNTASDKLAEDAALNTIDGGVQLRGSRSAALSAALERQYDKMEREGQIAVHTRSVSDLGDLAERLAPLSGVKHVVLLTTDWGGSLLDRGEYYTFLDRLHRRYRSAGVMLDAIDIAGLAAPWSSASPPDTRGPFWDLTLATGGTFAPSLDSLRKQQSVTYILGFTPPATDKKDNAITVRVRNQPFGTVVRYRRGYSTDDGAAPASNALFLADVLMNDIAQNGINVDLDVARDAKQTIITARLPGPEVLALGKDGATLLDAFFYVFDENNVVASWSHTRFNVDHEKAREFLSESPFAIRQRFPLPPGRYAAKALVRVVGSDVAGFARKDLEIPR